MKFRTWLRGFIHLDLWFYIEKEAHPEMKRYFRRTARFYSILAVLNLNEFGEAIE